MTVYTFIEARKKFASLLTQARKEGKVLIRRKDGSLFSLTPEKESSSPLDVKGIKTKASTEDILAAVRESRRGT
ncbi:MAG TPA: hypothetical protein VHO70_21320 [Chitinispirillaceae bacterium]|nr:hypothetical protein [Chitinispirillaceae bacterium]